LKEVKIQKQTDLKIIKNSQLKGMKYMKINANNMEIEVIQKNNNDNSDYISLTDIAKYKNVDFPADVIKNWLRSRTTIEYLGLWEQLNNPGFKLVEFDQFKFESGSNSHSWYSIVKFTLNIIILKKF